MLRNVLIASLFAIVLSGCGRDESSSIVARANGHVLTADEVARRGEIMASLTLHKTGKEKDADRIRAIYKKGYASFWAEGMVLADFAAENGIEVPEETLKLHRQAAFRNFKAKGDKNYEQMISEVVKPEDRALWDGQVRDEGLRTVLKKYFVEQYPTNIGEAYADAEIAKMQAWNASMALTNALQYAKATNAWQRICRGEDFVAVAKATTEIREEIEDDCEWTVVDEKFLSDEPALKRALAKMKVGDITPPIPGDNGIIVVRFDKIEDDGGKALSRIFFHLPRFYKPAPKAEIIKCAEDEYADDLFTRKVAELVSAAKIEYLKNENENKTKGK